MLLFFTVAVVLSPNNAVLSREFRLFFLRPQAGCPNGAQFEAESQYILTPQSKRLFNIQAPGYHTDPVLLLVVVVSSDGHLQPASL